MALRPNMSIQGIMKKAAASTRMRMLGGRRLAAPSICPVSACRLTSCGALLSTVTQLEALSRGSTCLLFWPVRPAAGQAGTPEVWEPCIRKTRALSEWAASSGLWARKQQS